MSSSKNLRRSSRIKKHVNYADHNEDNHIETHATSSVLKDEIEKQLEDIKEDVQTPLELFSKEDVSGKELYRFQKSVRKDSMMIKANQCCTPKTPVSLKTLPKLKIILEDIAKSPENKKLFSHKNDKVKVTKKTDIVVLNSDSMSEDVSDDNEYIPDNDESSESDEVSDNNKENESSSEEEINVRKKGVKYNVVQKSPSKQEVQNTPMTLRIRSKILKYNDYHIKSDDYFESQYEKMVTSDNTLGKLLNPRLTEKKLEELLMNQSHVSTTHKKRINSLTMNCKLLFPMWQFIMEEGYSLLLYGLGSKRNLINDFHNDIISDYPTLVVNGFFPSLSIKDVLNGIITDLLDLDSPANPNDCLELIEKVLKDNPNDRLYLIIHNIDGIMLRSNKTQNILASLAIIPNIRIIASIDHINAPLLWDHTKRAKFNFYWWDAATFLPYQAETSYESSLLVQQSSALALSSLQNVFLSLTSNARAIYIILVKYQLNNSSSHYAGMPFKDLYRAAREQFLVSSDLALRAQLTEFIDHKLVRTKRNVDGAEHLTIPLDKGLLKQFLEEYGS